MATSGNYRKFYIDNKTGKKYVHTLNPKTGYPTQSNLLSASVIAKNCTLADGYATAFMAMGYKKSKVFLDKHPELQAFLVYSDEQGKVKTYHTIDVKNIE
jgi:thiamine biosynthesis lipoprotein